MADRASTGARLRLGYGEALAHVLTRATALEAIVLELDRCCGRVLVEEVVAGINVPSYARSAVDGFAVNSMDLSGADPVHPVRCAIEDSLRPGDPLPRPLRVGACARVATGAPVPEGADAIVMFEDVEVENERATFSTSPAAGKHVIRIGEDVTAGEVVLARGRRLRPQDLGVVASLEIGALLVVRKPRVQVLVTGNEIVAPGNPRGGTHIVDSNSIVVRQLAARDGAELLPTRYVSDDAAEIGVALGAGDPDVVLVSGGSSVGAEDHAPRVLERIGVVYARGAEVRPGGPVCIGRVEERWVFLLPGHPLACLAAYEMFAGPAIRLLGGRGAAWPHAVSELPLAETLESARGRTDYARIRVEGGRAWPMKRHTGASNLSSSVRADGAVLVPADIDRLEAGEVVRVFLYD